MKEEERRGWISLAAGVAEKREGEIWVALVFLEGPGGGRGRTQGPGWLSVDPL